MTLSRLKELENWIRKEERVVVAFSGGVDSALLAYASHQVLGDEMIAVTGDSPSVPRQEREFVQSFSSRYGISHQFIKTEEFEDENYRKNPENRCYFCKSELFKKLAAFAIDHNYHSVLEGTNVSDMAGHRPGLKASQESETVKTPYIELGILKEEIRRIAANLNLDVADKPSSPCLASRVPWGTRIEADDLEKVERAEEFLKSLGFREIRVRHHGDIARLQVAGPEWPKVMQLRNRIETELQVFGYKYVTLDLRGYGEKRD